MQAPIDFAKAKRMLARKKKENLENERVNRSIRAAAATSAFAKLQADKENYARWIDSPHIPRRIINGKGDEESLPKLIDIKKRYKINKKTLLNINVEAQREEMPFLPKSIPPLIFTGTPLPVTNLLEVGG
jgi:hypothetical protein